jgi:hypothetical protein
MSKLQDEHLEFFFEMSIDLMCIAGVDGYFKRVNPAFTKGFAAHIDVSGKQIAHGLPSGANREPPCESTSWVPAPRSAARVPPAESLRVFSVSRRDVPKRWFSRPLRGVQPHPTC